VLTRLVQLYLPLLALTAVASAQQASPLPSGLLAFGVFTAEFRADGSFTISGQGWPTLAGNWKWDAGGA
jgi:hypothetical protein